MKLRYRYLITFMVIVLLIINSCIKFDTYKEIAEENKFSVPGIPFQPEFYVCQRTAHALNIDGRAREIAWKNAAWTDYFVDIEGELKPEPRYKTRAKMLWDDQFFYIYAELEEPDVWATITKRDEVIYHDNDFEVFIDPDGDTHFYYELEINAYGTEWDLLLDKPYRDGATAVTNWDMHGLKSKVYIDGTINQPGDTDRGWSVEIAIPWNVLKECTHMTTPPEDNDQWRVNFSRVQWQVEVVNGKYEKIKNQKTGKPLPENNWVWSPQGLIAMHYPEMWGYVQFSNEISGSDTKKFTMRKEENAKWILRQLYYKQRSYHNQYGSYTENISDLDIGDIEFDGYQWPPRIETTQSQFEIILKSTMTENEWHIFQDGRVIEISK